MTRNPICDLIKNELGNAAGSNTNHPWKRWPELVPSSLSSISLIHRIPIREERFPQRFLKDFKQNLTNMNGYKRDQIEYVDVDRWRKAIRDSRLHYEAEAKKLNERIESISLQLENIERELEHIRVEEELMSQTIRAYEERMEQPSRRSTLQGNNLRETLIIHFTNSGGVIIGKEASKTLVELGYFTNRDSADGAVYTTLGKPPFQKLDRGIYFIPTDSSEWKRLKGTNGEILNAHTIARLGLKEQHKTKLMDKVESILAENPTWNRKQVSKELQKQGWDFGGKNPNLVVNGIFMKISKDPKQTPNATLQPLLSSIS